MKNKYSKSTHQLARLATFLLLVCSLNVFSQTYYARTGAQPSSIWNSRFTWSTTSCIMGSATSFPNNVSHNVSMTCRADKVLTVTANVVAGNVTLSTGTLSINSDASLTATSFDMSGGTLTIDGTLNITSLNITGGTVNVNGTLNTTSLSITNGTLNATSLDMTGGTLNANGPINFISGGTGAVSITGGNLTGTGPVSLIGGAQSLASSQSFYDLNIAGSDNKTMLSDITVTNELQLTANNLVVGNNTLTVGNSSGGNGITSTAGKLTLSTGSSLSFGGSWTLNDLSTLVTNTFPLTINNFTMTKSTCTIGLGSVPEHDIKVNGAFTLTEGHFILGPNDLRLYGAISGNSNGYITGGPSSGLLISGSGPASMYFDLSSAETVEGSNSIGEFILNRTSHPFVMLSSMRTRRTFLQAPNSVVQITTGPVQKLTIDGPGTFGANLIGHPNAILQIDGLGNFGSLTFASTPELRTLIMNRGNGTATMNTALTVGTIEFRQGVIQNPAGIVVTGNTPDSVIQESSSSQLFGPLTRTIAPNTNAANYIWPIGKYYVPAQNLSFDSITTGPDGNVLIQAEAFEGNSGGSIDSTLSNLKTNNYWKASVVSNVTNLTSVGKVSLIDYRVASTDVVGYSTSRTGVYTSLGGNVAGYLMTSTLDSPTALGYYNFATPCSIAPTVPIISASSATNCQTQATTLSIISGTLNSATEWRWYSGSCGGTLVGTGNSIVVSPTSTTIYFVRGEGGCVMPGECADIMIWVSNPEIWYADADGDTFGDPNVTQLACTQPENYSSVNTDCDDTNPNVHPGAAEIQGNGIDDNCNGSIDEPNYCIPPPYTAAVVNRIRSVSMGTINTVTSANSSITYSDYSASVTDAAVGSTQTITVSSMGTDDFGIALFIDYNNDGDFLDADEKVFYDEVGVGAGWIHTINLWTYTRSFAIPQAASFGRHRMRVISRYYGTFHDISACYNQSGSMEDFTINVTGAMYADADGDGYGSGNPLVAVSPLPSGFSLLSGDCNDNAVAINPNAAEVLGNGIDDNCSGVIDENVANTASYVNPNQCGVTLTNITAQIYAYQVVGATGYRFEVTNAATVRIYDAATNSFNLFNLAGPAPAYGMTYSIRVAVKTGGFWKAYGFSCNVTTPVKPATTTLTTTQCGSTIAEMSTSIYCNQVTAATLYRFEVSGGSQPTRTYDSSLNRFAMTNLSPASLYATTYSVKVAMLIGGVWQDYGAPCSITTPASPPTTSVIASQCGITISNSWTSIYCNPVTEATGYRFEVKNGAQTRFADMATSRFSVWNLTGGPTANTVYTIRVAILYNGVYQAFGPSCTITTAPVITKQSLESEAFAVKALPNPFADSFRFEMNSSSSDKVEVKVYDMLGRMVESRQLNVSEVAAQEVGSSYPSGVYNIIVIQGENVETLRMIKR